MSPEFMRAVASQVRPAVIFDSNGSILADLGGMQYLEAIQVSFPDREKGTGTIMLKPKLLLTVPPEITGMGGAQIFPIPKRGPGYEWAYGVDEIYLVKDDVPKPYHSRLEIIR